MAHSSFNSNMKASSWSITINNPTASDDECLDLIQQKNWFVSWEGQKEVGENGTPHYQGLLKTKSVSAGSVKKALPRAHIEKAKNVNALTNYVHKNETRVGELATRQVATFAILYESIKEEYSTFIEMKKAHDDYVEENADVVSASNNFALALLDRIIRKLIVAGYVGAEMLGARNEVRCMWKLYFLSIGEREFLRINPVVVEPAGPESPAQGLSPITEVSDETDNSGGNRQPQDVSLPWLQ